MLNDTNTAKSFRTLCEELSQLIEKEGWSVRPYASAYLKFFSTLEENEKRWVVRRLQDYLTICKNVHRAGRPVKDARHLVEEGLRHFNLSCDLTVEALIKPGHVVEFYGKDHRQIFRTFNYFEFTSYTLEEVYCCPWYLLYDRSEEVTGMLLKSVKPILDGASVEPVYFDIPEHSIAERASLERLKMMAKEIVVSPLMQKENLIGYLNVIQVRLADEL